LDGAGIEAPGEVLWSSNVGAGFADAAARRAALLVVTTRHERGGLRRALLGDHVPAIVAAAPCPVLVTEVVS
jgi:nucleotide-binding universal stress UspA family protein